MDRRLKNISIGHRPLIVLIMSVVVALLSAAAQAQDDIRIWREFVSILKKGDFLTEKIRPYLVSLSEPLLSALRKMSENASWEERKAEPEIHLKQQISFENYRRIFETIWQDRATNAGWKLVVTYEDKKTIFNFRNRR